jgi:hypothetical protein
MQPTYEYGFHIAWDRVLHETRKAYANMRTDIVDALAGLPVNTRKRVLDSLRRSVRFDASRMFSRTLAASP